jgi:hypothetical protein
MLLMIPPFSPTTQNLKRRRRRKRKASLLSKRGGGDGSVHKGCKAYILRPGPCITPSSWVYGANAFETLASGHFLCSHYVHNMNQSSLSCRVTPTESGVPKKSAPLHYTRCKKIEWKRADFILFFSCDTVWVQFFVGILVFPSPPTMFP